LIGGLGGVSRRVFLIFDAMIFVAMAAIFIVPAVFYAKLLVLIAAGVVIAGGKALGKNGAAKAGRGVRGEFRGWGAEVGLRLELTLAGGGKIVGHGFFFVESDLAGVGADETFIEDATGKLIEVVLFQRAQHAGVDFRGIGDGIEIEAALLALFAKFFPEGSHVWLRRASGRPHRDAIIIGEGGRRTPELV